MANINAAREMNKSRRDSWGAIFGYGFILLMVAILIGDVILNKAWMTPVGLLHNEQPEIYFNELNNGQMWLYGIGTAVQYLALIALAVCLMIAAIRFSRGEFFTKRVVRLISSASWISLSYILGCFIENMGNNWYLQDVETRLSFATSKDFILSYAFMITLSLLSIGMNRARKLQEDQEGLI